MNQKSTAQPAEHTLLWLLKILAGLMIVVFLTIHFIVNHLVAPEGLLTYADVIAYYNNPIIPIMEILFLGSVLTHALLGVRSIILDLNPAVKMVIYLDMLLLGAGILAFIYGIWLTVSICLA